MGVDKLVKEFEEGKDIEGKMYKNKEGNYIYLNFNVYKDQRDVFVHEIEKNKGIYVEKEYETPTIYGHELEYSKLVGKINTEYEEVEEDLEWVSSMETDWELYR